MTDAERNPGKGNEPEPDLDIEPLSDEDLADVAGGLCSYTVCSTK